jgi:hypothetical protein
MAAPQTPQFHNISEPMVYENMVKYEYAVQVKSSYRRLNVKLSLNAPRLLFFKDCFYSERDASHPELHSHALAAL